MTECCNCSACSSINLYYIKYLCLIPALPLITKLLFAIATIFSAQSLRRPTASLSFSFSLSVSRSCTLAARRKTFHATLYHQASSDLMSQQPISPTFSSEDHYKLNAAPFRETDIKLTCRASTEVQF